MSTITEGKKLKKHLLIILKFTVKMSLLGLDVL